MSKTSIIAVVLLLCAVGFAYSQGWFDLSRRSVEIESDKVSTDQDQSRDELNKYDTVDE